MLLMQLKSLVLTLFNLLNNSLSDFSVTYIIFPYLYLLMDGCFLSNTPLNINDNKLFFNPWIEPFYFAYVLLLLSNPVIHGLFME